MQSVSLPHVKGDPEQWSVRPVWIRDGGTLHAILWLEHPGQGCRMFLVRNQVKVFLDDDDSRASVCCGKADVHGLVQAQLKHSYQICPRCARMICPGIPMWSAQFALDEKINLVQSLHEAGVSASVVWAIERVDTQDETACVAQLHDIAKMATHASLRPFTHVPLLGRVVPRLQTTPDEKHLICTAGYLHSQQCHDRAQAAAQSRMRNIARHRAEQARLAQERQGKLY